MLRPTAILLIVIGGSGCAASNGTPPASPSAARGSPDSWFRSLPGDVHISDVNPGRFAGAVVVDLDPDAGVCPARAEGMTPKPWHLRCAAVEATGPRVTVRGPLLVCGWLDDSRTSAPPSWSWDSTAGFTTQQLISGSWMVLGARAGVRLTELGPDGGLDGPTTVNWVPAPAPIPFDDWAAKRR